ncbi:Sodium/calcium exchanger protein-domain-containing protein [Mycena floridula]|nr:Sodium/calcium exchanger protein-domain-containing protein [Mycena floridula]
MSLLSSRVIFALLFALNCILWSQSQYGQVSVLHGPESLVKRIAYELDNPGLLQKECRPITLPTDLQCAHVNDRCTAPLTFLSIHYLKHYFCTDVPLRPAVFVALLLWLVFLFSTLGISASDFFTPNLATIAQLLGLDENVAGVTFLAFGNGSPDVFSTFSAMRAGSGSLAIGELLGAASFIVSCVVGSMCIIKPFEVHRGPFLRDVGFFSVAVGLLMVILWDGAIRPWEAASMVVLYLIYVLSVVIGTWWQSRRQKFRETEALARAEYQDDYFTTPYRDDPSSSSSRTLGEGDTTPTRVRAISAPGPPRLQTEQLPYRPSRTPSPPPTHSHNMPSFSLVGALEFREVIASLRNQSAGSSLSIFDSPITPYAGGHYHSLSKSRRGSRTVSRDASHHWDRASTSSAVPLDDRPQFILTPALSDEPEQSQNLAASGYFDNPASMSSSIPSISHTPASPTSSDPDTDSHVSQTPPPTRRQQFFDILGHIYHTIFPSLHHFRTQSILGQIASLFAAPAVMLLTLTLPVVVTPYRHAHVQHEKTTGSDHNLVDFEEEGAERVLVAEDEVEEEIHGITFNKWLAAAQCICGPLFCTGVLFSTSKYLSWVLLATSVVGVAMAALVAVIADKGDNPTFRMARTSMGFFVACVWIMAIADEVVNVLQTFGFIFGLSDAIIGLTVFAVGNSLADLVANMSVAVFAPIMGFSACFGGPMLNILLGVGLSGSYVISQTHQPYELHFGTTLFVSVVGLLALLAMTLVFVPFNGYFLTRRWGIFLIVCYTIIMSINVIVELKS